MNEQITRGAPDRGPLGSTGDGDTGVPEFEQDVTNRPGNRAEDDVDVDLTYDDIESTVEDTLDDEGEVDEDLEVDGDEAEDEEDEVPGTGADDAE